MARTALTASTLGISFDWAAILYGDSLRFGKFTSDPAALPERGAYLVGTPLDPFTVTAGGGPNTNLSYDQVAYGNAEPNSALNRRIPSFGNATLELELVEGGTETITWTKAGKTYRVDNARYLVPRMKNINSFQTASFGSVESRTVQYDYTFPADDDISLKLDTADNTIITNSEESIRLVEIGDFAMLAYDWTDTDGMTESQRRTVFSRAGTSKKPGDLPVGTPNRYYVGAYQATIVEDGTTVDVRFTHRVIANGAAFFLDFAGMGSNIPQIPSGLSDSEEAQFIPEPRPSTDFSAGDKITVEFAGGSVGLPNPGAKVVVAIPDPLDVDTFTDEQLDAVTVVPNPYLVDHLGQRTMW